MLRNATWKHIEYIFSLGCCSCEDLPRVPMGQARKESGVYKKFGVAHESMYVVVD